MILFSIGVTIAFLALLAVNLIVVAGMVIDRMMLSTDDDKVRSTLDQWGTQLSSILAWVIVVGLAGLLIALIWVFGFVMTVVW